MLNALLHTTRPWLTHICLAASTVVSHIRMPDVQPQSPSTTSAAITDPIMPPNGSSTDVESNASSALDQPAASNEAAPCTTSDTSINPPSVQPKSGGVPGPQEGDDSGSPPLDRETQPQQDQPSGQDESTSTVTDEGIVYDSATLRMSVKDKIKRLHQAQSTALDSSKVSTATPLVAAKAKAMSLPKDARLPGSLPHGECMPGWVVTLVSFSPCVLLEWPQALLCRGIEH